MHRTPLNMPRLLAIAMVASLIPSPILAVPPHSSEGECADLVVDQYNKDGDEEGLKFGLQDCNDAYATEEDEQQVGIDFYGNPKEITIHKPVPAGTLVLLPPYGNQVPQSLSESSSSSPNEPRLR